MEQRKGDNNPERYAALTPDCLRRRKWLRARATQILETAFTKGVQLCVRAEEEAARIERVAREQQVRDFKDLQVKAMTARSELDLLKDLLFEAQHVEGALAEKYSKAIARKIRETLQAEQAVDLAKEELDPETEEALRMAEQVRLKADCEVYRLMDLAGHHPLVKLVMDFNQLVRMEILRLVDSRKLNTAEEFAKQEGLPELREEVKELIRFRKCSYYWARETFRKPEALLAEAPGTAFLGYVGDRLVAVNKNWKEVGRFITGRDGTIHRLPGPRKARYWDEKGSMHFKYVQHLAVH